MTRVAHVVQALSRGGAGRALVSLVDGDSTVVSLRRADPLMRGRAEAAGAAVHEGPAGPRVLADADVVLVHFWNTPELWELLRSGLPPVRLAVWAHVAGDTPPQVVTRELVELADVAVVTAAASAELPVFSEPPRAIPAAPDLSRLTGLDPRPHDGFVVGYIGSLDRAKLHPRFAELCGAVRLPGARFVVCGAGDAAAELAATPGLELRGYVEEIAPVLSDLDVFGYPLAPGSYATSDLALQEAMAAGVPPVVLRHGQGLVEHGVDGLVARDEDEYPRLIERLHADPEERRRLGRAARERALARGPADVASEWSEVYAELLTRPKRPRPSRPLGGAAAFVASLGDTAPEFAASLDGADDATIASSPPALVSAGAGGVLHYRSHYPDDPHLALWAGLVLEAQGSHALAVSELVRARRLGLDVTQHLERTSTALGTPAAAQAR